MKRIHFSLPWPISSEETYSLLLFIFQTSLFTYAAVYFLDTYSPGFFSDFVDPTFLLVITILTAGLVMLWPAAAPAAHRKHRWSASLSLGLLAALVTLLVWRNAAGFGQLRAILSLTAGLVGMALGWLALSEPDDH